MDLKEKILNAAKKDLEAIEKALKDQLNPYLDLVSEVAGHLLFSGGKRLRPLLMVLSARICGYQGDYDKIFSTTFEYLHAATLLHDDLVDEASVRRGNPVAHSLWGNSTTVLVGDFLLARALSIAAGTGKIGVIRVISGLTEMMSQGEIHQLMKKGDIDLSEDEYLTVIRNKTAELFQGACRASAIISDAPEEQEMALAAYGLNLGMAFQIADDLFDYTLSTADLGKEIGADLKEGKMTLPLIYALTQADEEHLHQMNDMIKNPDFSEQEFRWLVGLLDRFGGLSYAREKANTYITEAKKALTVFGPSKTKSLLEDIADYSLARKV
jgi:octaprenyl-diphosphate synthase